MTQITVLFNCDIQKFRENVFQVDTPFGRPITVSKGNEFAESDELEAKINELLEALKVLTKAYAACNGAEGQEYEQAQTAIAKATDK